MNHIKRRIAFAIVFTALYLLLFYGLVGWKPDHLVLLLIILGFTLIHDYTFRVVLALSGFIGFIILYDAMTFMPNYSVNDVHIKDLYDLEVQLFGVYDNGLKVSLCEWFEPRMTDFQSFIYGFSYLLWVPGPMIFALFLMLRDKDGVLEWAFIYLLTNVLGIIVYYLFPAAPPWYFLEYGNVLDTNIMGSEAYLSEFDRITGTTIFNSIYAKGGNVFGAIPSLHSAYPLIGLLIARRRQHKSFMIFFIFMAIGTWIGAIYSWHHYLIDVLLGILCAYLAYLIASKFYESIYFRKFKKHFDSFLY